MIGKALGSPVAKNCCFLQEFLISTYPPGCAQRQAFGGNDGTIFLQVILFASKLIQVYSCREEAENKTHNHFLGRERGAEGLPQLASILERTGCEQVGPSAQPGPPGGKQQGLSEEGAQACCVEPASSFQLLYAKESFMTIRHCRLIGLIAFGRGPFYFSQIKSQRKTPAEIAKKGFKATARG